MVFGGWFCSGYCWLVWKWLLVAGLEVIVCWWFRSDSTWLVWKWLLVDGLKVVVGGWFKSACWLLV